MSDYLIRQLAAIRDEVKDLKRSRTTHKAAQVTAVDTTAGTFAADLPDGQTLAGVSAPASFMPAVGDWVRLRLDGATPIYEPARIGAGAVGTTEIAPGTVTEEQLAFDPAAYSGTTVHYGTTTPTGSIGDLWLKQVAAGPPPEYETRRWEGTAWVLLADQGATEALLAAEAAQAAADSKAKLYEQTSAPVHTGPANSAIWTDTDDGNVSYRWDGSQWVKRQLGNGAIKPGSLVASDVIASGTITAGLLEAVLVLASEIIAGNPTGHHTRQSGTGFRAYAPDPAGGLYEVTRMGTGGSDVLGVSDPSGRFLGGITDSGALVCQGASIAEDPVVMGRPLVGERLAAMPFGLQANGGASFPGLATDVEYEMMEVPFRVDRANRSYRLRCGGFGAYVEHTGAEVSLRVRYTTDGSEPTVASPTLFRTAVAPHAANYWVYPEINEPAWYAENAPVGTTFRLLATLQRTGPVVSRAVIPTAAAFVRLSVEDTGPSVPLAQVVRSGSSGGTGSAAPSQLRHVTDTYSTWSRTWRGNGTVFTDADAYQGSYGDSNGNMYSLIGFPDLTAQLAGATIEAIQVYLYAEHWYYNAGGTAVIGVHGHTSTPGTVTLAQYDKLRVSGWGRATPKWVTLPSSLHAGFKDGSFRGIALGPGPTTDRDYYGRFAGGDASIVRLTYVR